MNRLSNETSPYLLQHAHNPVHWYPWSDEALKAAVDQQKPILVSIGYAACHWCHVMERESFENEATAAIMNDHFINIKIDREERSDLDHIYMDAVQAISGSGGWPLNVFLTPEAKPFFGGTYFPPQKAFGRNSWTDVLLSISSAWKNRRDEIEEQAEQLIGHIRKSNNFSSIKGLIEKAENDQLFSKENCRTIAENLLRNADTKDGGFGAAPKFPQTFSIQYLLQHYHFSGHTDSLTQAELSLQKMIAGGINDQLGGGFARYSTDAQWLAPHFEKMLYDNALLISVLCDAYQLIKKDIYAETIRKILFFIEKELKDNAGGFYAAIDADSEGVEGKFYVWSKDEITALLGVDADLFCKYYNVSEEGNWEHQNILHVTKSLEEFAAVSGMNVHEVKASLERSAAKLLEARSGRIRPITDDKILMGWNALLLTAYCKAAAALREPAYKKQAETLFAFMENAFSDAEKTGYHHTYKNGVAKFPAFLDDLSWYIQACIYLQEITSDPQYLLKAKSITEHVFENFEDVESNYFFFTHAEQRDVVVRKIELYDGATPSANGVMAHNLLYLGLVFDDRKWREKAETMIRGMADAIVKYPGSFGVWAGAVQHITETVKEIVITGKGFEMLRDDVLAEYVPGRVLQASEHYINMTLLNGKSFLDGGLVYLCRNYVCDRPVRSADELTALLKNNLA